ncbi:MAG: glycosyltransferase family 2 protein [Candidatus Gastranaerophilales bacterium]|nr:glycosyltransferase family 2 protein [Candidatus Gastranaerophilales bacterium]
MNILILMAGSDKDFCEKGYPQYLIEIQNKPMIQRTIEHLETVGDNITCIIRKEDQDKYFLGDTLKILSSKCKIIEVAGNTKGAVCSALFAIDEINNDEELLLINGSQLIKTDIKPAIDDFRARNLDGGIVTINAVHPKYSSVLLDENKFVIQTSEKRPISNVASTGCCYFKRGSDFVGAAFSAIEKDVNTQGQYYISSTFKEMILNNRKIGIYEIPKKDYITFSSYRMYEDYLTHRRG